MMPEAPTIRLIILIGSLKVIKKVFGVGEPYYFFVDLEFSKLKIIFF